MPLSDYAANKILDHMFNDGTYTPPDIYLGLSTTTPNVNGTGVTEPVGNNYARKQVTAALMAAAASRSKTNSGDINMNVPSGAWGLITHLVFYDALTSGNLIFFIDCADRSPVSGDSPKILAGVLTVTL
jgi:hypothetical protein